MINNIVIMILKTYVYIFLISYTRLGFEQRLLQIPLMTKKHPGRLILAGISPIYEHFRVGDAVERQQN